MAGSGPGGFEFQVRTRLVFGPGEVQRAGALTREHGVTRVLLVTDPGVRRAGHADTAQASLEQAGLVVRVEDGVEENPTTDHVARMSDAARAHRADGIVAVGGGSAVDVAKGANLLATNGGRMEDYRGKGRAPTPPLPLIAIPTTAGTGAEVQSYALIAHARTHEKMACGDQRLAPVVAILDPELSLTMPPRVTALTALDALVHAVETAVTRARNALSVRLAEQAFERIITYLPQALAEPADLEARGELLLAASLAGLAIENSMLGVAHSLANPLTACHDVPHGQAVATVAPVVVQFNGQDPEAAEGYGRLLATVGEAAGESAPAALAKLLGKLLVVAGLPVSLQELGLDPTVASDLAPKAAAEWTASFNPRPVAEADCRALYEAAWRGPEAAAGSS